MSFNQDLKGNKRWFGFLFSMGKSRSNLPFTKGKKIKGKERDRKERRRAHAK